MNNNIHPLRLLGKALVLFVAANIIFALWNPPVGRLSAYNLLVPGRTRFPFGLGVIDSNITVDDMDAMFAAHVISAPKAADEFRVVILGDSSVWGTLLYANETLAAQLNKLQFACGAKKLHFYNLGYPHPSVLQDLLILQKALHYQPDLILWSVTPNSLRPKDLNPFLYENIEQVAALVETYNLRQRGQNLVYTPKTLFERTLVGQRNQLSRLLLLQSLAIPWSSTHMDIAPIGTYERPANDVSGSLDFGNLESPTSIHRLLLLDHLRAGARMSAGIPVLFVNQPMFVATGRNSHKRYNSMYPRWAYDQYRQIMRKQAKLHHWNYLDLWKVAPPEEFTDYELHLSARGEQLMAQGMRDTVQKMACR